METTVVLDLRSRIVKVNGGMTIEIKMCMRSVSLLAWLKNAIHYKYIDAYIK